MVQKPLSVVSDCIQVNLDCSVSPAWSYADHLPHYLTDPKLPCPLQSRCFSMDDSTWNVAGPCKVRSPYDLQLSSSCPGLETLSNAQAARAG